MTTIAEIQQTPPIAEPVILDVPVPDHVPPHLVRDLRAFMGRLPNALDDPYAPNDRLFEDDVPPIMYSPFGHTYSTEGQWVLTRARDVAMLYQKPELFSSKGQADFQRLAGETWRVIPLSFDGAEHAMYRRYLNPWFTQAAVGRMEPEIRRLADELLDEFVARGGGDFAWDFARVFPVRVFFNLMGFSHDMLDQFLEWEHEILHSKNFEIMGNSAAAAIAWLKRFIAEKVAAPDDTLTSKIVNGRIDGRALTEDEQIGIIFFLWLGGLDTVASTLSQMFRRLAIDRDLQQQLRDNPHLIKNSIDEFLRVQPLVNSVRTLKQDYELHGVKMKAGEQVMALVTVANFDPQMFACPRHFDPERKANRHFTLASGPHLCLGQHLARQELRIALEQWLSRAPAFTVEPGADLSMNPGLLSVRNLPIRFGG